MGSVLLEYEYYPDHQDAPKEMKNASEGEETSIAPSVIQNCCQDIADNQVSWFVIAIFGGIFVGLLVSWMLKIVRNRLTIPPVILGSNAPPTSLVNRNFSMTALPASRSPSPSVREEDDVPSSSIAASEASSSGQPV